MYDQSGSGTLSAFELRQALNSAGYRLNNHVLNILVHRFGSPDGTIRFDDFLMCAVKLKTMMGKHFFISNFRTLMVLNKLLIFLFQNFTEKRNKLELPTSPWRNGWKERFTRKIKHTTCYIYLRFIYFYESHKKSSKCFKGVLNLYL